MGGLYDGMNLIARIFIWPLTIFTLKSELLAKIKTDIPSDDKTLPNDIMLNETKTSCFEIEKENL